jgi:hypothetical protein
MNMVARNVAAPKAPEKFFIGGKWREPISKDRLKVFSPVTEEEILSYPEAGRADIDRRWPPRATPSTTVPGRAWSLPSARNICARSPTS